MFPFLYSKKNIKFSFWRIFLVYNSFVFIKFIVYIYLSLWVFWLIFTITIQWFGWCADLKGVTVSESLEVKNGREKIFVINFYNWTSRVLLNGNHVHISEFVSTHLRDILQTLDNDSETVTPVRSAVLVWFIFKPELNKMFFAIALNSSKAAAENVNTMFPFLYSKKTH
jgi:hypothetical protein